MRHFYLFKSALQMLTIELFAHANAKKSFAKIDILLIDFLWEKNYGKNSDEKPNC